MSNLSRWGASPTGTVRPIGNGLRTARLRSNPKGRAIIANPLFGTTTAEIAALFVLWGDDKAKAFLAEIKDNNVKIATSNGEAADFVASGHFAFALVDSDDATARIKQGNPIEMIYPDQGENELGCFIVPNAVVLIKGGKHTEAARKLADYLLSRETEGKLALSNAAQIPLHEGVETPPIVHKIETIKTMETDYATVARKMKEIEPLLKQWVGFEDAARHPIWCAADAGSGRNGSASRHVGTQSDGRWRIRPRELPQFVRYGTILAIARQQRRIGAGDSAAVHSHGLTTGVAIRED